MKKTKIKLKHDVCGCGTMTMTYGFHNGEKRIFKCLGLEIIKLDDQIKNKNNKKVSKLRFGSFFVVFL